LNLALFLFIGASYCFPQNSTNLQGYRDGRYEGRAFNATAKAEGDVVFELYDLDPSSGKVRAYFGASNGLEGEAWLQGRINQNGELDLVGNLASYKMNIEGRVLTKGTIRAEYQLKGATTQEGSFEVEFKQPIGAPVNEDILGIWEVGGGLPAQINPVTGMSGPSFVDAHRLEFFPDGSFKHLWSHRHCDTIRCCNEQAMLEEGPFSFSGQTLDLTVTDGNLIVTDACNPKLNGHTPVKHGTFTYNFSIKPGVGATQLCLQSGSQGVTCYSKQS
jgi:hypothetical protein